MSRLALVFAAAGLVFAATGCANPQESMVPFVAVAGNYSLLAAPAAKPEVCPNCRGTGKVGDGRIFVPCPVCQTPQKQRPETCKTGTCDTRR